MARPDQRKAKQMSPGHCTNQIHPGGDLFRERHTALPKLYSIVNHKMQFQQTEVQARCLLSRDRTHCFANGPRNGFGTHLVLVLVSHDGYRTRLGIQAISFE